MTWAQVVDAAVLGASRAGIEPAQVLTDAAASSRARRAGFRPPVDIRAAPAPAASDLRPEPGDAATRRLGELLAAGAHDLVAEWLRLLAKTLCRPPDALMPALLTVGSNHRQVRDALGQVTGPLAGWLSGHNTVWSWATVLAMADDPAADWKTGTFEVRRNLLARLRASDPAAARVMIDATWATDSYGERAAFLSALRTNLSLDDEPLLERGLADRRAEVRNAAADLLARLPGSAWSRSAAARAAAAVRVEGRRLRVEPGAAQLVAQAPAGLWVGHTGRRPAELLAMQGAAELRASWAKAAVRDADTTWLVALLEAGEQQLRMLLTLPAADRDAWLCAHPDSIVFRAALDVLPVPWSVRLSGQVRTMLAGLTRPDRALLRLAGLRLEPPVRTDLGADIDDLLTIRSAMRRELAEEPQP